MNMQLVPEPFVEIPVNWRTKLAIKGGDKLKVSSSAAEHRTYAKAMVTKRIKPLKLAGKEDPFIQSVSRSTGLIAGIEDGRPARTQEVASTCFRPRSIDPNAYTPEFKGFLVKIEKA